MNVFLLVLAQRECFWYVGGYVEEHTPQQTPDGPRAQGLSGRPFVPPVGQHTPQHSVHDRTNQATYLLWFFIPNSLFHAGLSF